MFISYLKRLSETKELMLIRDFIYNKHKLSHSRSHLSKHVRNKACLEMFRQMLAKHIPCSQALGRAWERGYLPFSACKISIKMRKVRISGYLLYST